MKFTMSLAISAEEAEKEANNATRNESNEILGKMPITMGE